MLDHGKSTKASSRHHLPSLALSRVRSALEDVSRSRSSPSQLRLPCAALALHWHVVWHLIRYIPALPHFPPLKPSPFPIKPRLLSLLFFFFLVKNKINLGHSLLPSHSLQSTTLATQISVHQQPNKVLRDAFRTLHCPQLRGCGPCHASRPAIRYRWRWRCWQHLPQLP